MKASTPILDEIFQGITRPKTQHEHTQEEPGRKRKRVRRVQFPLSLLTSITPHVGKERVSEFVRLALAYDATELVRGDHAEDATKVVQSWGYAWNSEDLEVHAVKARDIVKRYEEHAGKKSATLQVRVDYMIELHGGQHDFRTAVVLFAVLSKLPPRHKTKSWAFTPFSFAEIRQRAYGYTQRDALARSGVDVRTLTDYRIRKALDTLEQYGHFTRIYDGRKWFYSTRYASRDEMLTAWKTWKTRKVERLARNRIQDARTRAEIQRQEIQLKQELRQATRSCNLDAVRDIMQTHPRSITRDDVEQALQMKLYPDVYLSTHPPAQRDAIKRNGSCFVGGSKYWFGNRITEPDRERLDVLGVQVDAVNV